MIKKVILLFLLFPVNCVVNWQEEVSGHNKTSNGGFSGAKYFRNTDFYLCSERKYRVHFEGYPSDIWSEEFTACQPAGRGIFMDAIAISGGLGYGVFIDDEDWIDPVTCYNISDKKCYAGTIGDDRSSCIYIEGDELYRTAIFNGMNSNEKNVSKKVINNFFKKTDLFYDYEKETKVNIGIKKDKFSNVTIQLFNTSNLNLIHYNGTLMIMGFNNKVKRDNTNRLFTNYLKNYLNEEIGLDKYFFENGNNSFVGNIFKYDSKSGLENGNIAINFYWLLNLIEIDIATKIREDYHSYRGGFRIKVYLNDEDTELLLKVRNICRALIKYTGIKITPSLKQNLLNFTSFSYVDEVTKQLGAFSVILEKILFYTILEKITEPGE